VLSPYLEAHQARLNAVENLQVVMEHFVSLFDGFYSHKRLMVHLTDGMKISSERGYELAPAALSSGEKQLLLLLCNAIAGRKDGTIFMIDEPEISLNVKWQRQLVPALLTCLSGTSYQLVLATHSIELLARYRDYVVALENVSE